MDDLARLGNFLCQYLPSGRDRVSSTGKAMALVPGNSLRRNYLNVVNLALFAIEGLLMAITLRSSQLTDQHHPFL